MKRLSLAAALALPLSLSPLVVAPASADGAMASPHLPAHKALAFFHTDRADHSLAAQARAGAFLEMTPAAP